MIVQTSYPTDTDIENVLSLNDALDFLRVTDTSENTMVQSMIRSAIEDGQNRTNIVFAKGSSFDYFTDKFCFNMRLPKSPLVSVDGVYYMDENGDYIELPSSNYYIFNKNGIDYLIFDLIPITVEHKKSVKISFTCGFNFIPADIKSWLLVRVATFYEFREDFVLGASISKVNHVDGILSKYKIWA